MTHWLNCARLTRVNAYQRINPPLQISLTQQTQGTEINVSAKVILAVQGAGPQFRQEVKAKKAYRIDFEPYERVVNSLLTS